MGTLTEEILSRKVGRRVHAGEIIVVDLDLVMSHDTTTPLAMEAFYGLTCPNRQRRAKPNRSAASLIAAAS